MSPSRIAALLLLAVMAWHGAARADDEPYRTPRAGEAYTTTLGGETVTVPARDRRSVTALNLGLYALPYGPSESKLLPFGALFVWRNWDGGRQRFRGEILGIYNVLRYNRGLSPREGAELVLTFDSSTIPLDRAEYVEGRRIDAEELMWHQLRMGLGLGWRRALAPGHQDNAIEASLTYEPGVLFFTRGKDTAPAFVVPNDTYEGRLHLRVRLDQITRNLLELPHEGIAAGFDGLAGHRARWSDWGGGLTGPQDGSEHRTWLAASGYAIAAVGLPVESAERHRLLASAYGGVGEDLDRFSAFHIGGGPNTSDWEALARPLVPGAAFDELIPSHYLILNMEYRYEALFFLYLHLRGSMAWVDLLRFEGGGTAGHTDAVPSLGAAVTSGFFWESQLELSYTRNFGLFRSDGGDFRRGRNAILLSWAREF